MLALKRKARLIDAMSDAGLDVLVVYGNAWQGDYLRYATDFGILEGLCVALQPKTTKPFRDIHAKSPRAASGDTYGQLS